LLSTIKIRSITDSTIALNFRSLFESSFPSWATFLAFSSRDLESSTETLSISIAVSELPAILLISSVNTRGSIGFVK